MKSVRAVLQKDEECGDGAHCQQCHLTLCDWRKCACGMWQWMSGSRLGRGGMGRGIAAEHVSRLQALTDLLF